MVRIHATNIDLVVKGDKIAAGSIYLSVLGEFVGSSCVYET